MILFWERIFLVSRIERPGMLAIIRCRIFCLPVCHPKIIKIYGIITMLVVLYGCETWSLTVTEERRLRVFESGVQRGIFGPKRGEVTREWRKLHNEELNDLYSSPNTWKDNKVRELVTVCLPWQHWTKALVWFDDVHISEFHRCVDVALWQSLSEWHLLLSACVLVCRRENVGA